MSKTTVFVRNPYNYDMDKVSNETGLECKDPSLAQQHMKDECDINTIVERFGVTGSYLSAPVSPQYGDFSGVSDYHSAINAVRAAEESFMALPAKLRPVLITTLTHCCNFYRMNRIAMKRFS